MSKEKINVQIGSKDGQVYLRLMAESADATAYLNLEQAKDIRDAIDKNISVVDLLDGGDL